jgi:hypothetical protein
MNLAPVWLQKTYGTRLMYSIGVLVDALADLVLDGVTARFPGVGTTDALDEIGADRVIVRGFAETNETYTERLIRWLDDWALTGASNARMRQLIGYLTTPTVTPQMRDVFQTNEATPTAVWHTIASGAGPEGDVTIDLVTPSNWNWDNQPERYWRIWPIVYVGGIFDTDGNWDDAGTWDDGGVWDTTASIEQVAAIRALVNTWRAAHAHSQWIILAFDNSDFDPTQEAPPLPDGTWGHWSTDNAGNRVQARFAPACYLDGPQGGENIVF